MTKGFLFHLLYKAVFRERVNNRWNPDRRQTNTSERDDLFVFLLSKALFIKPKECTIEITFLYKKGPLDCSTVHYKTSNCIQRGG